MGGRGAASAAAADKDGSGDGLIYCVIDVSCNLVYAAACCGLFFWLSLVLAQVGYFEGAAGIGSMFIGIDELVRSVPLKVRALVNSCALCFLANWTHCLARY